MSLGICNLVIALLANALRFYALKHFVNIFVQKENCRWKHVAILYIVGWGWTSLVGLWFSSPMMNVISNILSFFLIFLPYQLKWTKKCLAVFTIYVINALVDSVVILSLTGYIVGQPVNQVYECVTSLVLLFIAIIIERFRIRGRKRAWRKRSGLLWIRYAKRDMTGSCWQGVSRQSVSGTMALLLSGKKF